MSKKDLNKGTLSIHTENIFPIIKKWLYSEHDIFLRELISNAIDAMSKRKLVDEGVNEDDLKIELKVDKKAHTLQIIDNGIGMNKEEIEKYINQIAFSGAEDFVDKFKDKQSSIIGHFGLGFYSSFMVAEKVTIDSLSYREGEEPAFWECDGSTDYSLGKGSRKTVGTTVTVYLNADSHEYEEENKIKELVDKFSSFTPFPITMGDDTLNQKEALWNRKPKDVTEEEYKEFYKKTFHDWEDPLFWIHLNVDFPFNLKGILYFPKIKNEPDINKGRVKLFCNNVFVADNLKEFIPEFLLLLRGGIDIPDIPLNVSRSFLQHDQQVKKITKYIIKKVADHLKSVFKEDRERYEKIWEDVNQIIKYGVLTEEKFSDSMRDSLIFKSTNEDYVTVEEYLARNKSEEKPQKIFYAGSEDTQVSYIKLMKEQGLEVIYSTSILDNHLFQHLEQKISDIAFTRVDSEINDNIVKKDSDEDKSLNTKIAEIFNKVLNPKTEANFSADNLKEYSKKHPEAIVKLEKYIRKEEENTIINPYDIPQNVREEIGENAFNDIVDQMYIPVTSEVKSLKSDNISGMVVFNEHMRRYSEMNAMMTHSDFDMLANHKMIINANNNIVKKIVELDEKGKKEEVKTIAEYIHQLALLEQKRFTGKELQKFIEKANDVLKML
ncbi:MAG: molecular chaperone HtpG [Candidatus Cloacimonadota bacterium]|nr:MAG: molecular chaperone HtpG [Candidatus Cloacimonadota bacterium]